MLYVFGDSWAFGSELKPHEQPFAYHLSLWLSRPYENLSAEGMSLGAITAKVLANVDRMKHDDYVVVIIPPDVRWYTITDDYEVQSLALYDKSYRELIRHYNIPWFIYHHNLFIYTIITAVTRKTKNLILSHNYGGNLTILDTFKNLIEEKYLLSKSSLAKILSGFEWEDNYVLDKDGPDANMFKGKHFEGTINHPNQSGHVEIARLLFDKFKSLRPKKRLVHV